MIDEDRVQPESFDDCGCHWNSPEHNNEIGSCWRPLLAGIGLIGKVLCEIRDLLKENQS